MTLPRDLRRYADITLVSGSPLGSELANGSVITAGVDGVTYPDFRRNPIPIGLRYGNYVDRGRMQDAEMTLTLRSMYGAILASTGVVLGMTLEEHMFTPGRALAATGGAQNPRPWSVNMTGEVISVRPNDLNLNNDEIRTIPVILQIHTWTESYPGVATAIRDYDWPNQIFRHNGVNIFTGATT